MGGMVLMSRAGVHQRGCTNERVEAIVEGRVE